MGPTQFLDKTLVLVVGGDPAMRAMLHFLLHDAGCEVVDVATVSALIATARARTVALVVVVAGAGVDGPATARAVRQAGYCLPVLLLTHEVDEATRRRALVLDVRDVVALPVSPRDLDVRLRAALGERRLLQAAPDRRTVGAGGLLLRLANREVCDETGRSVRLTAREAALLHLLMSTPGRPLGRHDLLDHIWGEDYDGDGNVLEVYVRRLRVKLGGLMDARAVVRTHHAQGYLFDARSQPRLVSQTEVLPHVLYIGGVAGIEVVETLQGAGYSALRESGARALVSAQRLKPLLIMIECESDESGVIGVLHGDRRTADIPLIACAAASYLHARAPEWAVNDYLTTPIDRDELVLRVERLIGAPPAPSQELALPYLLLTKAWQ